MTKIEYPISKIVKVIADALASADHLKDKEKFINNIIFDLIHY
jgi:hypothetical protein